MNEWHEWKNGRRKNMNSQQRIAADTETTQYVLGERPFALFVQD